MGRSLLFSRHRLRAFAEKLRLGARDRAGATAVEFSLLAAPTLFMLYAIFQIGLNYFMAAQLDYATQKAARAVSTGAVSTAGLTASQFQNQVCGYLSSSFSCGNVFINMAIVPTGQFPSAYYNYVKADQSALIVPALNSSNDTFCPGAGGQYIVLQILYPISYFSSFFMASNAITYQGHTVYVLMSSITFKNEPFTAAATYPGC